jgi:dihydroorotate dehydrogenase electron transfer subunit
LLDYRITADKMRTVKILGVKEETPTVKSFTFHDKLCAKAKPGQFVMIWIPGVDEVPMSLSALNPDEGNTVITVENVGEATSALHEMKAEDTIGVRGPFGNGYEIVKARNVMIMGGGTGLASLVPLAERLVEDKVQITFLMGAKSLRDLLFLNRVNQLLSGSSGQLIATTEDRSYGLRGLVTEPAEKMLGQGEKFDVIYACGPEQMMYKMFLLSEKFNISLQVSLERFMRCAIGICGTCVIGKYRVCQDGPVFSNLQLREVKEEFGHFRRGFNGRKTSF